MRTAERTHPDGFSVEVLEAEGRLSPRLKIGAGRLFRSELWQEVAEVFNLTPRESQVAVLVTKGFTSRDIGRHLNLAEGTVGIYVRRVLAKTGTRNRVRAALKMILATGILTEPVEHVYGNEV